VDLPPCRASRERAKQFLDIAVIEGDGMKQILKCLLVFVCLCLPVSAQTPDACRADLQHLALPSTAQIDDGSGETPVEFLFSDHGADIYSAIPLSEPNGISWFISNGIRVIVVYQDEEARQHAIHNLIQPNVVADVTAGSSRHGSLDKLKFAVVHLGMGSSQDKLDEGFIREHHTAQDFYLHELITSGWHIEGIQYFEPPSCETLKLGFCTKDSGQIVPCVLPGLPANPGEPNWITDLNVRGRLEPYGDPQFVRIVVAMKEKLKEFAARKEPEAPPETTMGSSEAGPFDALAAKLIETYAPCPEATKHLQVPEGIHSALPGQTFLFMFSQDGIDAYAIRGGNPPTYRGALLVFQEDSTRREYLKSFIGMGSVSWYPLDNTLSHQDWKPIMNFKYATFGYSWSGDWPMISNAIFYAPRECYSRRTSVGALTRNELGVYMNSAADTLGPRNGVLYRAAVELKRFQSQTLDRQEQRSH
jgi:hypothetical protein